MRGVRDRCHSTIMNPLRPCDDDMQASDGEWTGREGPGEGGRYLDACGWKGEERTALFPPGCAQSLRHTGTEAMAAMAASLPENASPEPWRAAATGWACVGGRGGMRGTLPVAVVVIIRRVKAGVSQVSGQEIRAV